MAGWPDTMSTFERNVHNFVNGFDLVPRALGNGGIVRLFEVLLSWKHVHIYPPWVCKITSLIGSSRQYIQQTIASMKGDTGILTQYREMMQGGTDLVFNMMHYQPFGEFYFLYIVKKKLEVITVRLIKADTMFEKRLFITMPVTCDYT